MSIEKSKENLMQPNKEYMLKHLKFITDGMDDYCDGRIEVGGLFHTNTNNYTIHDLESACNKALLLNKTNNVYCIGSFLDPDILPSGRSNDEDFYATNVLWCDIDAEHNPEQLKELYKDCPPNRAVVTARVPHRRIHLWWKLDEPIVDPDTLREALRGIANKLGGDTMVTNPTSLMRLAGSVNYPTQKKKDESGRVNELTEYIEIHENKVSIDKILRVYPDSGAPIIKTDNVVNIDSTVKTVNAFDSRLTDGRDKYMSDMVLAAIYNLTRDLNRLPTAQEVFDDAWPVYSVKVVSRSQKGLDAEGRGQKAMMQKINSKLRGFQSGRFGSVEEVIKSNSEKTKRTTLLLNQNNQNVNDEIIDPDTGEIKKKRRMYLVSAKDRTYTPDDDDFVQGLLTSGSLSVVYGESNCGKTFFMTDLSFHIAEGKQWREKRVDKGVVIYVALEGEKGLDARIEAYKRENNSDLEDFYVMPCAFNFLDAEGDVTEFIELLEDKKREINGNISIVVVDTLARALSGGDENSGQDMGLLVSHADAIRAHTKAHVCFIHHSGKNKAMGARGHSSLRAAVDTELEISREEEDNYSLVKVVKQRDLERGDDMAFSLKAVELGVNKHNEVKTSCVVEICDTNDFKKEKQIKPNLRAAYDALVECIGDKGRKVFNPHIPNVMVVNNDEFRQYIERRGILSEKESSARVQFSRYRKDLIEQNLAVYKDNYIWIK